MNRSGHETAQFFYGREVEHTPMHGQPTLFVIGYQQQEAIEDALARSTCETRHIFFGANDSYRPSGIDEYTAWDNVISTFLDRGYWCSLDVPFDYVEQFHEGSLCERDRFIPIIKIPVPYIRLWNYNTCIKIDDRDFAATNPGVWVHSLHDLMSREKFTDWSKYQQDRVIE